MTNQNEFTKAELLQRLNAIAGKWHAGTRQGNDGNAGHTFEDLVGVEENNFSLPDFGDIEIKTQRVETGSLVTLFHKEPQPAATLPKLIQRMGWQHKDAGTRYGENELSFRSTTQANKFSVRGFRVESSGGKIVFNFDENQVARDVVDKTNVYNTYGDWLIDINSRTPNYKDLFPIYWDESVFADKCVEKLDNTLYKYRKTHVKQGTKMYMYTEAYLMKDFKNERIQILFDEGALFIDFDARTGHNHGTKLRVKLSHLARLFDTHEKVL